MMRALIIRALGAATAWLDAQNDRVLARRSARAQQYEVAGVVHPGEVICPDCVFIYGDDGEVVEAIDCKSNRHALFQKLNE